MFQTNDTCTLCNKLTLTVESTMPITNISSLPSTYDERLGEFRWKYDEVVGYVLIPSSFDGTVACIDLYLCIEERDHDSIDVYGYALRFLEEKILSAREDLKMIHLTKPSLKNPQNIICRRKRRYTKENQL